MPYRPFFSFSKSKPSQTIRHCFRIIGWDGLALILNILLLILNIRQNFRYRESPDRYPQIHPEEVHLLSKQEVDKLLVPPAPQPLPANPPSKPITASLTTPSASPSSSVKLLPAAKIPDIKLVSLKPKPIPANAQCTAFGPLTVDRFHQLQKLWKHSEHTSAFTWRTSQPLQHYSVIFPVMTPSATELKHEDLIHKGFKQHEIWAQGHSQSMIIIGSFEEEAPAESLIQRLHHNGFHESYMMVRTSPTLYWLNYSHELEEWLAQASRPHAYGTHWKAVPCTENTASTPSSPPST